MIEFTMKCIIFVLICGIISYDDLKEISNSQSFSMVFPIVRVAARSAFAGLVLIILPWFLERYIILN